MSFLARTHSRLRRLPRPLRIATVTTLGFVLVLAGLAMLVLPGPGMVVLFAGVAVLAVEFPWAAALLARMKASASALWVRVRRAVRR